MLLMFLIIFYYEFMCKILKIQVVDMGINENQKFLSKHQLVASLPRSNHC